jgi:hypothetical protein
VNNDDDEEQEEDDGDSGNGSNDDVGGQEGDDLDSDEEGSYDSETAFVKRPRRSIRGSNSKNDSAGPSRGRSSRLKKGDVFCFISLKWCLIGVGIKGDDDDDDDSDKDRLGRKKVKASAVNFNDDDSSVKKQVGNFIRRTSNFGSIDQEYEMYCKCFNGESVGFTPTSGQCMLTKQQFLDLAPQTVKLYQMK